MPLQDNFLLRLCTQRSIQIGDIITVGPAEIQGGPAFGMVQMCAFTGVRAQEKIFLP